MAMLLMEALGAGAASRRIQIFGTDIQELAVAQARAGVYSEAAMSEVSPARRKRFFAQTDKGWQVEKHIRDICVFARHDLAKDPPFSHLDLVSCRNVLIYMGVELQKRVLSIFQYALRPGRFLFLGTSSSIGDSSDSFAHDDRKHGIFVRKPLPPGPRGISYALNQPYREWSRPPSAHTPALLPLRDLQHEVERSLVEYYAPPAVVVDSGLHIVHFQGDTGPYLAPTTGQPSLHLLKMVRPDLVFDLRAIISSARRTGRVSHKDDVQFEYLGRPAAVRMEARPLGTGRNRSKQELIIVFQKAVPLVAGRPAKGRHITEAARLERELTTTRERLRGLITENGIVVAEMKTANEEALSSNEELQSTNEELETAKEELQSANEELISLNRELQHNNEELKVLSQDLNNLLTGLDIPVLVLDSDLRIRRFTPVAGALFNLMPGDVGRLFGQMANSLNISDWKEVLTEVTVHRRPVQREVTSPLGGRYSLRVHPYQNANNHLDAVLIVMLDMELIARARDDAGAARDLAVKAEAQSLSILNALTAHVAVVASDGVITATNQAWDRFAAEAGPASLQGFGRGANYLDMCGIAANGCSAGAQEARAGIQSILSGQATSFSIEYPCNTADRMLWFLMNVSPLSGPNPGAVVAHADVTVRKQAELALERSDAAIRALMEANPQAIIVTDLNQIIILANFSTQDMFGYTGAELIGLPLDCLIPESNWNQHQEHHWQFGTEMQSGRVSVRSDVFALHKDGRSFRVEVGHSTIETSEGPRAVAFIADISARVEAERALLQTQLQYYSLFENMQEGLAYCRLIQENGIAVDFEYLTVNTKYEAMTGQKNFVGRKLTEVMPGFRDLDREAFNSFVRVSTTGKPETFEAFIVSTNQWYSVSLYRPEKGTFVGVFGSINARKILEDNLRRNEERLRITVEGTGVGTFDSDMSSGKQFWSDTARQLFSIPDGVEV